MVPFLPRTYLTEAICNLVELWHVGCTSKMLLFLLSHCFISVLDKWQPLDWFYLITEHGHNSGMHHYGNHGKYTVISGDIFDISLPAGCSFTTQLPAVLESWSSHQAAVKADSVATLAVILPTAAAQRVGRPVTSCFGVTVPGSFRKKSLSRLANKFCVKEDCVTDSKE